MIQLRPYQKTAIDAVCAAYDQGWRQQILSIPTGGGKTIVFSALYDALKSRLPGKMLIVTNGEELVDQVIQTMRTVNPSLRVDKEMAEHKADPTNADAIVASVASLGRKNTPRLQKYDWNEWDKVIIDEVQHSTAASYLNVLNATNVLKEGTSKLLVGVSATPFRADGQALGTLYKKMTYVYSLRQAIEEGFLVKVRGY